MGKKKSKLSPQELIDTEGRATCTNYTDTRYDCYDCIHGGLWRYKACYRAYQKEKGE